MIEEDRTRITDEMAHNIFETHGYMPTRWLYGAKSCRGYFLTWYGNWMAISQPAVPVAVVPATIVPRKRPNCPSLHLSGDEVTPITQGSTPWLRAGTTCRV